MLMKLGLLPSSWEEGTSTCWCRGAHLPVWYMVPKSSASLSFTRDGLHEHKSKDALGAMIPSRVSWFRTFGKIIAVHHLVG